MRLSMRVALGEEMFRRRSHPLLQGGLALLVPGTGMGASCCQHRRPRPGCRASRGEQRLCEPGARGADRLVGRDPSLRLLGLRASQTTTKACSRSTGSSTRKWRSSTSESDRLLGALGAQPFSHDLLDAALRVEERPQPALRRRHVVGEVPHAFGERAEHPDSRRRLAPGVDRVEGLVQRRRCRPRSRRS